MNGVEILSENVIYKHEPSLMALFITFGIVIAFFAFCLFLDLKSDGMKNGKMVIVVMLCLATALIMGFLSSLVFSRPTDEVNYIEYKVVADDSVPINEFYEYYEIIDWEDGVFTVRTRTNETLTN